MVIWLIGLSGSGKTAIGRELYTLWKAKASNTVLVDGDEIRSIFKHDRHPDAYSLAGRAANAERIAELCAWLDRQGINVVCSILSVFEATRQWNRAQYARYFEVFISVPFDELVARDAKGLYGPALRGETKDVVGVDIAFPPPLAPDMIIDNSGFSLPPLTHAANILDKALEAVR